MSDSRKEGFVSIKERIAALKNNSQTKIIDASTPNAVNEEKTQLNKVKINFFEKQLHTDAEDAAKSEVANETKPKPVRLDRSKLIFNQPQSRSSSQNSATLAELGQLTAGVNVMRTAQLIEQLQEWENAFKRGDKFTSQIKNVSPEMKENLEKNIDQSLGEIKSSVKKDIEQINSKQIIVPSDIEDKKFVQLAIIYRSFEKHHQLLIEKSMYTVNHPERNLDVKYSPEELEIMLKTAICLNYLPEYDQNIKDIKRIADWAKNIRTLNIKHIYADDPNATWVDYQKQYQVFINTGDDTHHPYKKMSRTPIADRSTIFAPVPSHIQNEIDAQVKKDVQLVQFKNG